MGRGFISGAGVVAVGLIIFGRRPVRRVVMGIRPGSGGTVGAGRTWAGLVGCTSLFVYSGFSFPVVRCLQ